MGIKNYFSNHFETSDNDREVRLQTHYYDDDYQKCKNVVIDIAKAMKGEIKDINDDYREILIVFPKYELIVSFYNPSYYVTGIDFSITSFYGIPFGRPIKNIDNFYDALNHQLRLKKVGGMRLE